MKTLYVTDLDGTLLTREERVSAYSREKINGLIQAGMLFTFATARSFSSAQNAVQGLDVSAPAVLYNGGLVYDFKNHVPLKACVFQESWKWDVLHILQEYGVSYFVFAATNAGERVSWIAGSETDGLKRYMFRRAQDKRMAAVWSDEALLDGYVFYFKCIGPREKLERAWNILKYDSRFICIFHQETYQNDFWMEISPKEASKANGVAFLRSALGADRVVCFGDTSNDSDMFDICEEKYAVLNADDWLKAKATGVIGYCEEDGVAKWLTEHAKF